MRRALSIGPVFGSLLVSAVLALAWMSVTGIASARREARGSTLRAVTPAGTSFGSHGTPLVSRSRRGERLDAIEVVLEGGMRTRARIEWLVDELGRVTLDGEWPPGTLRVESGPPVTYEVLVRAPERVALAAPNVVRVLDRRPGLVEVILDQPMPLAVFVVLARSESRSAWTRVDARDARFGIGVPRRSAAGEESWSFAFADELGRTSEWSAPLRARR